MSGDGQMDEDERTSSRAPPSTLLPPTAKLRGLAGSPGVAVGAGVLISPRSRRVLRRHVRSSQIESELARFEEAVGRASDELREVRQKAGERHNQAELSILDAYILMLNDEVLYDEVRRQLAVERKCVEWAVSDASAKLGAQLEQATDAYLRERGHDIRFVGDLVVAALTGEGSGHFDVDEEPKIVIAHDLSPAETARFTPERVLGIITEVGTHTSHTAILARALGIPAVVGCAGLLEQMSYHESVLVDGTHGVVVLSPSSETVSLALEQNRRHSAVVQGLKHGDGLSAASRTGEAFELHANIELPFEAPRALEEGADGIGLYRTEFLLVERDTFPSESEQFEVYCRVLRSAAGKPVTLRTFDIGGDKFPDLIPTEEGQNPALGLRAIRFSLAQPEVLRAQFRAMLRASARGTLKIMVPMITTVTEFDEVRTIFEQVRAELREQGESMAEEVPLGCMIEVPAAALVSRHLAERADFFSVGTNDLVQYVLAVDRGRGELAHLANSKDPAVLMLLAQVHEAAEQAGIPVSVCGAMASEPLAAVLLFGLGFRVLSLEAAALAHVRAALGRIDLQEAVEIAQAALAMATAGEVEAALSERFGKRFADLLEID